MKLTVISHFYNEEYLLPWWLKHHREIFDHGILIDYGSTDRSVELCREMVPEWEVIRSRNQTFTGESCDTEVMDIERGIEGWKIALNTTEFLCCRNLRALTAAAENRNMAGLFTRGAVMVDPPGAYPTCPTYEIGLPRQRYHGFFEDTQTSILLPFISRNRLLHRFEDGQYFPGRHRTAHENVSQVHGLMLLWYAFSPWSDETKQRKLQIKNQIPPEEKEKGYGFHHLLNSEQLQLAYMIESTKAVDLRNDPFYAEIMN